MFDRIEIAVERVEDDAGERFWLAVLNVPARQGIRGLVKAAGRTRMDAVTKLMQAVRTLEKLKFLPRPAEESGEERSQA